MASVTRHLWSALDLKLSEIFQVDLFVGLLGGAGAVVAALNAPQALLGALGVASQVMGVVLGAMIGGVAIQAAFLDQSFLRKIRAINRDPVRYLAPFLFTAVIGVGSMLGMLAMSVLTPSTRPTVLAILAGITGFLTVWAIASILPCLATLVQFIGLKMDALDVDDDLEAQLRAKRSARG